MNIMNSSDMPIICMFFLCKQWYLPRLTLEKDIFKAENETICSTNDHLWRSKLCPRTENTLLLRKAREAQIAISRENSRERERERNINILFYNPWVPDIFVLLPAIIMQYLYDSVQYALKVWVSFKFFSTRTCQNFPTSLAE